MCSLTGCCLIIIVDTVMVKSQTNIANSNINCIKIAIWWEASPASNNLTIYLKGVELETWLI